METSINCYKGIGKRKTSVAKVIIQKGSGSFLVNQKSFEDFFSTNIEEKELLLNPLVLVNLTEKYDINVQVHGGGITGQFQAIKLAIAKAICQIDLEYRYILNQNLLLRRDARIKERRKYGLKKARKASQYSKR
uniref:Ribosomal protein S9 n=1 Tax=Neotessella volvocina TaxID=52559 RepID=A0A3G2R0B4_9STRA|nr:ribosomal protein S9 [Neotessella volvocina]